MAKKQLAELHEMVYGSHTQSTQSNNKTNFSLTDFYFPKKENNFLVASSGNIFKNQNQYQYQQRKTLDTISYNQASDYKLRKKIDIVNKMISPAIPLRQDFRNRPMLNLNTPNLNFSSKDFINASSIQPYKGLNIGLNGSFYKRDNKYNHPKYEFTKNDNGFDSYASDFKYNSKKTNKRPYSSKHSTFQY